VKTNTGILAFCGSKGSGKNTSADIFKEITGVEVEELALAGHLKETCAEIFGIDYENFVNQELKERDLDTFICLDSENITAFLNAFNINGFIFDTHIRPHIGKILKTPREVLQYTGTEILHTIDPLIHAKMVVEKRDPTKVTILTDLRFVNEFNYFELRDDFTAVYVKNSAAEMVANKDPHPSEQELHEFKSFCYELDNQGSLIDLRENIKMMAEDFGL